MLCIYELQIHNIILNLHLKKLNLHLKKFLQKFNWPPLGQPRRDSYKLVPNVLTDMDLVSNLPVES